ncbi:hypothetical protein [Streptomyces umbrinus]|uniref:hypothetical protein n=1 Tax=Streptomyces umbrinus TaxID=67370 RepID=UPI0034447122
MITWISLAVGVSGTGAALYFVAPAGRGAHRFLMPRSQLRANCARLDRENNDLAKAVHRQASEAEAALEELDATRDERDDVQSALEKAALRIAELEEQLRAFDQLCGENTELRSALSNAHAVRPLAARDDASALPDDVQEFVNQTATAWRKGA